MSDHFVALAAHELERFLERSKASSALPDRLDMPRQLQQILERATELVPSESGAILLDDPLRRPASRAEATVYFVAAFGPAAYKLLGEGVSAAEGIAGKVYRTGASHLAADVQRDPTFAHRFDADTGYITRSIIAAPIRIGGTVCGAIELLNRKDGAPYSARDLAILEVFASYTASSLQNALDALQAHELAKRDDLTGLFNNRLLHVALRAELRKAEVRGTPCALVFIDLDHFKPINDRYGHLVGSQVLREVGYLFRKVTAERDAVLARYGGDEFAIVLPGADRDEAVGVAEAIRKAITQAVFLPRKLSAELPALSLTGALSASLGVEVYRPPGRQPTSPDDRARDMIRRADEAMYMAKRGGKNRVVPAWALDDEQQMEAF